MMTMVSKTESIHENAPMGGRRTRPNLILKHEILSEECDLFRASLPNRLYVSRVGRLGALVILSGLGHLFFEVKSVVLSGLLILAVLTIVYLVLSQAIEEDSVHSWAGVQYTVINGFNQETCTFYALPRLKSFYIFESFDGLKVGHFFNLKITRNEDIIDAIDDANLEDVVLFEGMRPPVEFLRRVYRKFQEFTK